MPGITTPPPIHLSLPAIIRRTRVEKYNNGRSPEKTIVNLLLNATLPPRNQANPPFSN